MWRCVWLVLVWVPMQAAALSCDPWHLEDGFKRAQSSADEYVVVQGVLDFPKARLPQVDWNNQQNVPPETRFNAKLRTPIFLSRNSRGDVESDDFDIAVIVRCAGPWCPGVAPGAEYLSFLRKVGSGYELEFGACRAMGWQTPDAGLVKRVRKCLAGRRCTPPRD